MTAQAIASYTKEENGKKVPMWTEEQVSEIVTAQVSIWYEVLNPAINNLQ